MAKEVYMELQSYFKFFFIIFVLHVLPWTEYDPSLNTETLGIVLEQESKWQFSMINYI